MTEQLMRLLIDTQTILVLHVSNLTSLASSSDIEKIISKLSLTAAIGSDGVSPKLVKLANKVISGPISELNQI